MGQLPHRPGGLGVRRGDDFRAVVARADRGVRLLRSPAGARRPVVRLARLRAEPREPDRLPSAARGRRCLGRRCREQRVAARDFGRAVPRGDRRLGGPDRGVAVGARRGGAVAKPARTRPRRRRSDAVPERRRSDRHRTRDLAAVTCAHDRARRGRAADRGGRLLPRDDDARRAGTVALSLGARTGPGGRDRLRACGVDTRRTVSRAAGWTRGINPASA
jgi:hypothetical protein